MEPNDDLQIDAAALLARMAARLGQMQQTIEAQGLQIEGLLAKLQAERTQHSATTD